MNLLKASLIFCVKCATFTAIFWLLWLNVIRPITTAPQNDTSSRQQDAQSKAQMDAYERQMERSNRLLDMTEDQQKRMDQDLTAQEENTKRFDAVLKVWEKQTGLRK